jgi:hypothetical protein
VDDYRPPAESAQYPFADVSQLREWPQRILNPQTTLGGLQQLLLTAEAGRLPTGFSQAVVEAGFAEVEPQRLDDGPAWRRALFRDLPEDVAYPWTLSELGLQWYAQGVSVREGATLVAGDTAWDFALFYALRRWTTTAYWLPHALADETGYLPELRNTLGRILNRRGGVVRVVSASDDAFRDQVANSLSAAKVFPVRARSADWREVLPDRPNRLWEKDNPGRAEPIAMYEGRTVELPTPIPFLARTRASAELHWVTDVRGHGWAPIRHGAVGKAVVDEPGFGSEHARSTRTGVAYTSAGWATWSGVTLEMSAVRPLLRPAALIEQLNAALGDQRWSCAASDKGAYAAESAALFGGFRDLARALLDPAVRAVLEAFRDARAPGKKAGDRRYLTVEDMAKVVGDRQTAYRVCVELASRDVLTRGLFLKCSRCRRAAWYGIAEVTTTFTCRRCRDEQRMTRDAWLGTVEPAWHYELAEVVYAMFEYNGELPILAVAQSFPLPRRQDEDVEVAFELDVFSPDGRRSEVDIAVRQESTLWLGEATTKAFFESSAAKEISRLERLSEITDLLAAGNVLMASSAAFRETTERRIRAVFGGYWPALRIEERVQTMPNELLQIQLELFKSPP